MTMNPHNFRPRMGEGSQQYMESTIRSATPAKLRLMLIERAIEVSRILSRAWREGELPGSNEHSISLLELLGELLDGIGGSDDEAEKKLCGQVSDLYVFLTKHLVIAEERSDAAAIEDIRLVLETEAETWRAVCARELAATRSPVSTAVGACEISGGLNFSA